MYLSVEAPHCKSPSRAAAMEPRLGPASAHRCPPACLASCLAWPGQRLAGRRRAALSNLSNLPARVTGENLLYGIQGRGAVSVWRR